MVDALNAVFGPQTDNRAVHAKGILVEGTFTPATGAASLSRAPHLGGGAVPAVVRFSDFAGLPQIPDADPNASPRGMAVKLRLPGGAETDVVTHSFNGFPVATGEEFRQMLLALAATRPGAPSPTPVESFFAAHPRARAFFEAPKPPPVSFTTLRYFGVNSFKLTNADGRSVFGRYRLEPAAGEQALPAAELAKAGPDYLRAELRARLARGPAAFQLGAQIAAEGDVIDDPSQAWPDTRLTATLGTITLTAVAADGAAGERALIFDPAHVVDGIEPADPMIRVRSEAYGVSYARRHA
jgi:catalase